MDTQRIEEPIFKSTYGALAFAYRCAINGYPATPLAHMMHGFGHGQVGRTGFDGAGQAGAIKAVVAQLNPIEAAVIVARFSNDAKENSEAQMVLIRPAAAALGTGVHNRRMVDFLVQRYFGHKVKLKELSATFGMHPNTMTERWACIKRSLGEIECRAMDRLEARFQAAGLVP